MEVVLLGIEKQPVACSARHGDFSGADGWGLPPQLGLVAADEAESCTEEAYRSVLWALDPPF